MSLIRQLRRHAEAPKEAGDSHLNRSNSWDAHTTLTAENDVEFYVMVLSLPGEEGQAMRKREEKMIRLIAIAGFALALATSAQAMTPAPIPQPDGMVTQVAAACGAGRTRVNGVCVARTTIRQTRRAVRRY